MSPFPSLPSPVRRAVRWRWLLLAALIGAGIVWMTLQPGYGDERDALNLIPFDRHGPALACFIRACSNFRQIFWLVIVDVVGNVAVFVPFGFAMSAALPLAATTRRGANLIVLSGFLLSLLVEVGQLGIPTRTTDVDDLLFNTTGTVIGLALWVIHASLQSRKERQP
ncbi:MAG: VanZ family protein [Caldilineae bacterium]|nr:MAG: VanZ family protein [Caldilineae bacterium]